VSSSTILARSIAPRHIQDTGDFNGDGKSDILWRHGNGEVAIWQINVRSSRLQVFSERFHRLEDPGYRRLRRRWQERYPVAQRQCEVVVWQMNGNQLVSSSISRASSVQTGKSRPPAISTATARATSSGAMTAGRSRSGRSTVVSRLYKHRRHGHERPGRSRTRAISR